MMTLSIASASASSAPGLICSQRSAFSASTVRRGSTTMVRGLCASASHHIEARLAVRPRQHRVMTPKQDASRRHLAGVIAHREVAEGQDRGVHPRMEALGEARLAPVGGAERMAEARHPADMMAAGAGAERDGLRPVLVANGEQHARRSRRAPRPRRCAPTRRTGACPCAAADISADPGGRQGRSSPSRSGTGGHD